MMRQSTKRIVHPERPQRRADVAQNCFPESKPKVAVARLSRWINTDPEMLGELRRAGYKPHTHYFPPKVVNVLVSYMGIG